jgi:catechol 2,3-dioxygenase-like lactoylglutathione lyase family enzyme
MEPNQIVLYVKDIAASRAFYASVLEAPGIEPSPTFIVFPLSGGWTLALLSLESLAAVSGPVGGYELVFTLPDQQAVDAAAIAWKERGATIVEKPAELSFGYAFLAHDPDGNRLRVGYFPQG